MGIKEELTYLWRKLHRRNAEADMDEEIRAHIELEIAENMADGMTEAAARQAALKAFGNVTRAKEESRQVWGFNFIQEFFQDLRFALRIFHKTPLFTLVALITLALGIGANTAIFTVINAVLLKPLPFSNADRLVTVFGDNNFFRQAPISAGDFLYWQAEQQSFTALAVYSGYPVNLAGSDRPMRIDGIAVSSDFFSVIGTQPSQGRGFNSQDNQAGNNNIVIISDNLWRKSFHSRSDLLGQQIKIDDKFHTVVGIMPADFHFIQTADLITPLKLSASDHSNAMLRVIARLKDGINHRQATTELIAIAGKLHNIVPLPNDELRLGKEITPLQELLVEQSRPALLALAVAVGFVLLIACANLANLMLARAIYRQREMAIRAAMGASRGRLIRQLLTESSVLAVIGGAIGCWLAYFGINLILAFAPANLPRLNAITIDLSVLCFTLVVSLLTGLMFGLLPALQITQINLIKALKEQANATASGFRRFSLRNIIMVGQVALTLVLLTGAGLMINSFFKLIAVDPGFAADDILTLNVSLPDSYMSKEKINNFYRQALLQISNIPGVKDTAIVNQLPLGEMRLMGDFRIKGITQLPDNALADKVVISANYFRVMNIPLQSGRFFNEQDIEQNTDYAIVSESFARSYLNNNVAIGSFISIDANDANNTNESEPRWLEVIGIVGDIKQDSLASLPGPAIYLPYTKIERLFMLRDITFTISSSIDTTNLINAVMEEIQRLDADLPVHKINTIAQLKSASLSNNRFNMTLLVIFALIALMIATTGIYGVIYYSVVRRTREIGIRVALGARPRDILTKVIAEGMSLTFIGIVIGLMGAGCLMHLIESMLYRVNATDPFTFIAVTILLMLVALIANLIPARKAMNVDPSIALRVD